MNGWQVRAIAFLLIASLGCADARTPTATTGHMPEITTSVAIDSCTYLPVTSGALDSLCGRSSNFSVSPDFVYPDVKMVVSNPPSKIRTIMTGPATWSFSDPHFSATLLEHFNGRPLRIQATWVAGSQESRVSIFAISGRTDRFCTIGLGGSAAVALDNDGFPIIDTVELSGSIDIQELRSDGFELAAGVASAEIRVSQLPVATDRTPPVVERPDLSPGELRAAPGELGLGDKTLVFSKGVVSQAYGTGTVTMCFNIVEEDLKYVDEVRMDFAWIVHDPDVWEPGISSAWNTYQFDRCSSAGPNWPVGAELDIVVGFVDIAGDVRLMRTTTTVQGGFRN